MSIAELVMFLLVNTFASVVTPGHELRVFMDETKIDASDRCVYTALCVYEMRDLATWYCTPEERCAWPNG